MVHQVEIQGKSYREVGENLGVDSSTVCRTVALFNATSNVNKRKHPPNPGTTVLTEIDKIIILETVLDKPEVLLRELQQTLILETGTCVDVSTIWRFLQVSNFTRQNMVMQRSDLLQAEYLLDMQVFHGHPKMLVFVDETGADRRNCLRRFEYSLRGKPAVSKKLLVRGQRVLAIAAMSTEGILDCYTVTGSVSGSQFSDFVQQALLPQLQPFNGVHECSQCGDTRQCFYPPRRWCGGSY